MSHSLPHLSVGRTTRITEPGILSQNTLDGCCFAVVVIFVVDVVFIVVVDEDNRIRYTFI